jgi:hypothetical protein
MKVVRLSALRTDRLYFNKKFSMTPSGIEPASFRLVAQRPNQLRHQQRAPFLI